MTKLRKPKMDKNQIHAARDFFLKVMARNHVFFVFQTCLLCARHATPIKICARRMFFLVALIGAAAYRKTPKLQLRV